MEMVVETYSWMGIWWIHIYGDIAMNKDQKDFRYTAIFFNKKQRVYKK
jgi:hypothetical protein